MITKQRFIIAIAVFCLLLAGFSLTLYHLQVKDNDKHQNNKVESKAVQALRGSILDRDGNILADSKISHCVRLSPSALTSEEGLHNIIEIFPHTVDTLPIARRFPYTYSEQSDNFKAYLKHYNIQAPEKGTDLLHALANEYGFGLQHDLQTTRQLVGLYYELDLRRLGMVSTPYIVAEEIDQALLAELNTKELEGVFIETISKREYPSSVASHLLGHTGRISEDELSHYLSQGYTMNSFVGKTGVEARFEELLHGTQGKFQVTENNDGIHISSKYVEKPIAGNHVSLTISLPLQTACEKALQSYVTRSSHAVGGAVAIVDVNSGEVLSLASYPSYELSSFSQDYNTLASNPQNPLFHRALQGTYAPGSTFKMLTAIAALEEDIITKDTKILDTGIYTYYDYPQPQCYLYRTKGETHGVLDLAEAMAVSCNIYFFDIGRRVGIDSIANYAKQFGLGEPTGIELPQAAIGSVASPETSAQLGQTWFEGNTLSAAIGQENNRFSPLQLANYIATVANGGTRYRNTILHQLWSHDKKKLLFEQFPHIASTTDLKASTLSAIKDSMLAVTQTEELLPIFEELPFQVGAKTGSAQVGTHLQSNAVFVCFAPFDDPQIAMAIVVEEGGVGSNLAPIARDILLSYDALEMHS